jgi:AraC-like DNA-binding protein
MAGADMSQDTAQELQQGRHQSDMPATHPAHHKDRISVYGVNSVAEKVDCALREFGIASATLDGIADILGFSSRTLMRRLAHEGLTYQRVLDDYRKEWALWSFQHTDKPFTVIAFELGFGEASNFSRTFRRWFGKTPSAVRSALRRGELDKTLEPLQ